MTKRLCWIASLLLFLSSCAPSAGTPSADPTSTQQSDPVTLQILFIGNSHMYTNNLPRMFARLAEAGGHKANVDMAAKTGYSLEDHVTDSDTLEKIDSAKWDIVVLQENMFIPGVESKRNEHMFPAARFLDQKIRNNGAQTIFFMTWASAWHIADNRLADFVDDQARISVGYQTIAQELDAPVAPVGIAFEKSLQQRPDLFLWKGDDYLHANGMGTYLAACVLYAFIYRESPEGLSYMPRPEDTARFLQSIAAQTVLTDSTP
ncbi:MAG: hypothetical protein GTN71_03430 [Anaerolineae bacterium]|nr:hypothetical protein [Anaerolineae bacterium]